jgi:hypothetical protein
VGHCIVLLDCVKDARAGNVILRRPTERLEMKCLFHMTSGELREMNLVTLAAMLGHSKINMVLRYAHPTQEHQTKAMNKMEQYVAAQRTAFAERNAGVVSQAIQ